MGFSSRNGIKPKKFLTTDTAAGLLEVLAITEALKAQQCHQCNTTIQLKIMTLNIDLITIIKAFI